MIIKKVEIKHVPSSKYFIQGVSINMTFGRHEGRLQSMVAVK